LNFFRQTKVKTHDMAIVEVPLCYSPSLLACRTECSCAFQYFAEVVKEQQSLEMHGPGAQVRSSFLASSSSLHS
jgi:hypothetical protein